MLRWPTTHYMQPSQSLATPFQWLEKKLESFFDNKYWQYRLVALAVLLSLGSLLLFNYIHVSVGFRNLYHEMRQPGSVESMFWDDIIKQGADPFTPQNYQPGTHEANQTFRLTLPLLSRLLRLNVATFYLFQVLFGFYFLWLVAGFVFQILKNKVLTFYFLTGFTAIYTGACFFINYFGHGDVFPFCFLVLALLAKQPVLMFIFLQLAFWCDERALINASFIGLWCVWPLIEKVRTEKKITFRQIPVSVYVLIMSAVVYVVLRKWLEIGLHLSIGHDAALSINSFFWSISTFGDKITRGYEGLWLVIIAAVVVLILAKKWGQFALFFGAWLLNVFITTLVADGTRALSFGFIGLLLAVQILKDYIPSYQLKYLLIASALISLMLPISFP